ncbi:MALT paracaspase 2 isoform X3 [Scleropages formosus]|uniref:MALT paracaspase 2 isoform X3 n=1 Tax=Scleropages formosus TaxID=113540 RepID=UPI0008784651|nr:mucosa-associated lymphoid tissue lymphoma translocation protein 1-like isoform X3 [Scleropages formosus]
MGDWNQSLAGLGEGALRKLADLLDNPGCGWKQLAATAAEKPEFRYSEKKLVSCSLEALKPTGSPGRFLLAMLADQGCSVDFLLHCLRKMEHHDAVQYLTSTVTEQIRITGQPESRLVPEGESVILRCQAKGPAGLGYQWFKGKEEVPGANGPELVLRPLTSAQQGHYICRVNYGEQFAFSQWARIHCAGGGSFAGLSSFSSVRVLRIVQQPRHLFLAEGDCLHMECIAEGSPPPQYQWYHNKDPLPPAIQSCLKIPCVTTADRGRYSCRVYNIFNELWSDEVHVSIGPGSCDSWPENVEGFAAGPVKEHRRFYATDKVALLIGNMNYQHHRQLRAPMADVHELTNLLRQLDFKVVSLLDLNWQEMRSAVTEFLLLLDRGVYGLLYFAGHGYENYGSSFMVPIDAPASYTSEHCLRVQDVLQRMQERQTGLNVFLLDMCRKRNLNDAIIPQPGPMKVTANIVFGYATCVDAEAYEVNKDDLTNGIFMSFLKQRLLEDEKVTVMLDRVAEDMGHCEITRGRQALELRSNLSERRALTDLIQSSSCPVTTCARNLQWSIAHVLPDSRCLEFDCGVRVQLGFAAEFSNIMIIYTRIVEKPSNIISCSALLSDFSEDFHMDLKLTNQQSPREAGSWLLSMDSACVPTLYTRFSALQKLKKELTFNVCLHYRYNSMDDEVREKQMVSVGKPLVAKLNLHEPRMPHCLSATYSSCEPHSFSLPDSSFSPEQLNSRLPTSESQSLTSACLACYSKPGEYPDAHCPRRANLPEESISPEYLQMDATLPLQLNANRMHSPLENLSFQFHTKQNFHSV